MKATLPVFFLLGFIAGFADTATFIHLSGLFSSHVTGNFVVLAAALAKGAKDGEALKILSVPVFVLGVASATYLHDLFQKGRPEQGFDHRLAPAAGILLLIASAVAYRYGQRAGAGSYTTGDAIAGIITVLAMGIQNAIHRFAAPLSPTTTVMTSNITQLTVLAWRRLYRGAQAPDRQPPPPFSLRGMTGLTLFFGAGCAVSALLTLETGLAALAIPGLLLIAVTVFGRQGSDA